MGKIIKLDKNLANQIAAGEVVERPVSVVKELVENCVDAGADYIKVEILGGGIEEIKITDNGEGISQDDLSLTIEKYSTSKIQNLQDLYNIMTFGFRGEALASISSVSDFKIISKQATGNSGYMLSSYGGENNNIEQFPTENGTSIIVKNLFFNTPARLHYLKKPRTEYAHINDFLNQMALSYPEIGFEFISDGKNIFKYQKNEDIQTRIYHVYGKNFSENLNYIESSIPGLTITGYISNPKVSFSNKNRQSLFINHRVVKSPLIFKAVQDAYNRYIPHGSQPGYIINIDIDPTQIDVNVHPRKLEVRFANEQNIFRSIYHAVEDSLKKSTLITPELDQSSENNSSGISQKFQTQSFSQNNNQEKYYTGSGTKFKSYSPYKDINYNPNQERIPQAVEFNKAVLGDSQNESGLQPPTDLHETKLGRIIGQMHNSYIIVETPDGMQILDQHALAERIIYEKLVNNQYKSQSQGLLISQSVQLTPKQLDILQNNKESFSDMGFELETLSGGLVMINAVPDFIKKEDLSSILEGILNDFGEHSFNKSTSLQEVRNKLFAYTACRSAIKFGNKLNIFEMNQLLNDSVLDYSLTCPHGRPVIYEVDLDQLKDKYER